MKKFLLLSLLFIAYSSLAQVTDSAAFKIEQIEKSLNYSTGTIDLNPGDAKITVPASFKFLNKEQAWFVLSELWGNPQDSSVQGLLVPSGKGVLDESSWVYTISYDPMGYVKDDDAKDIDYEKMLKEQQKESKEASAERIKLGYPPIEFVNWAELPHYDNTKKILHWAKELKFGDDSVHTLNYNLRILGRNGIFVLNAVASMNELPEVKSNIDEVLQSISFNSGSKYNDYDKGIDKVAVWTIGGLVAGKLLAKAGLLALLAKFGKVIVLVLIAAGGGLVKFIKGKKNSQNIVAPAQNEESSHDKS